MSTSTTITGDDAAHDTPGLGHLKDKSLKAAGIAYLIGDVAMGTARLMEEDISGAAGSLFWGAGSLAAARYGNPKAEQQLKLFNHRLGEYLKKQGVDIPKTPDVAALNKQGGVIDHIESFLYKYPSQTLNAIYAAGGVFVAKGGWKKGVKSDFACGVLVAAGGLAGLLIPEKKPDSQHPPQGALEKAWAWAQEKPLRVSGALYHINNIFTVTGAFEKRSANLAGKTPSRNSHWFRFLTAASFVFANTMLALSSKGHGGGESKHDGSLTEQLARESAAVIAAQPKEVQEALVQNIAGYLSSQPEIGQTAPEIAELLHAKLAETQKTPTPAGKWQQHVQPGLNPTLSPSL